MTNKMINSKYEIYLEIALIINKNMYSDQIIPYYIFKATENKILQMLKYGGY